jgi:hypothetical protein
MDRQFYLHSSRQDFIIHGENQILDLLKKRGFRLHEKEVRLSVEGLTRGLTLDYLGNWKGRSFVVEVKVAQKLADWLFHWMSHSILALQAARRLKGWEPLLAIYADSIDLRIIQRFKGQIALYAPDLWWMVADADGNLVAHLPSGDEEEIGDFRKRERARALQSASVASSPSIFNSLRSNQGSPILSFGDLDQWLLKVLLFARPQAAGWGGPRGPIRNLAQLAKLASVSPPLVYRWAAAMERSSYLSKRMGRVPVLVNSNALLAEWRGRYRISDNNPIACSSVFGEHLEESFREEFLNRLRQLLDNAPPCALSGHQACRFYRLKHSDARSIHLYFSGESSVLMKRLQLVESQNPAAPVILLQPRHRRSVFGGVSRVDGVPVCDILQVYLDLYHLPDRGREQAEFIQERMLEPIVRAAAEPSDGM